MNRREFMRLAAVTSALTLAPAQLIGATESEAVAWHGALSPLPPGAVRPDGWLRGWLQKQAAQLGSHLPEISWPFTQDFWGEQQQGAYWLPEQEDEDWWPWEQKGYWIDGATRLAILLRDEQLLEKTRRPIAYTFLHPDSEGYLGPELFQDPLGDYHRWPHVVFFRSVAAMVDASAKVPGVSSAQIAELMQRHYLTDTASYGKPKRNVNNIEDMLWCYSKTREPRLMTLAENTWVEYQKYADDPENSDLGFLRVMGDTPIHAHGATYAETVKQPAILYLYTGRPEYLQFGLAAQRRIFDFHMLIDGIPSTSEWFSTTTALDSHETCDIADHTWSWGYYLMATGDAHWGDRIERACFNAAPGALRNDWKALQYLSCPNQFLATLDSDHNWPNFPEHGMSMMAYQPNPGKRTACCGGNVHRILPNYVIRMWMKKGDGLAAVLYGPSTVNALAGAERAPVEIVQTTHYPFDDEIRLQVNAESPVTFPLSLRIPGWCEAPRVAVNGTPVSSNRNSDGFVVLKRTFKPGDQITLTLPMKTALSHWPQNGIGVERGPLVYSLPIEAEWTTKVEPKYSTEEFPAWEARPSSAWNYGLAVDAASLEHAVQVQAQPGMIEEAFDPWEKPPVQLKVPARKIAGWELQANPEKPEQKFTPPLPDPKNVQVSETVETITLAPYGSTKLRVTIFPAVKS
ncbi:MAG TPA: beta-L-arabinofuranosidase domain-containing protein [Acidobacteriaceae bacterium]|nr:beta-L-arabinofuranosidase domain-containing protein [Acidobacteriaceae bacterium]